MEVTTIGLDLGKDVFQAHGITADGTVVFNRSIRRRHLLKFFETLPSCLVGIEACGSAHHWARELTAIGHDVRLMPGHRNASRPRNSLAGTSGSSCTTREIPRAERRLARSDQTESPAHGIIRRSFSLRKGRKEMKLSDGLAALTEMAKGVEACVEEYTREEQAKHRAHQMV